MLSAGFWPQLVFTDQAFGRGSVSVTAAETGVDMHHLSLNVSQSRVRCRFLQKWLVCPGEMRHASKQR